ncbi:MAG TPA: peptidyl-prolyl cis-trans isomerase [Sphingomicrobium sp.]
MRSLTKSKVGSLIMILFVLLIAASFALGDVQNVVSGGFGGNNSTLATVGSEKVTDQEMGKAMEQRLAQVRQQNPEAGYSALAGEFNAILSALIDRETLVAFTQSNGFSLSPRLIGAEIAKIPGTRGLDGKFSDTAYQQFLAQQRLTDAEVRAMISELLMQRLILAPVASSARIPVGVATPYANMLLEARQGELALVPVSAFTAGLNPTDADIQRFYAANRARYMVPEQRVLRMARIGPEQVANVSASDQEIEAAYKARASEFAAREIRTFSQAVVPNQNIANQIAQRARGGASLAAAAAPAGLSAQDVALGARTKAQLASTAGDQVANAAFSAASGAVVGPVQSDLGWHVLKVESVRQEGGRQLADVRAELATAIAAEKRKNALSDLATTVEDAVDGGANFQEAIARAKLTAQETPLIQADGRARGDQGYTFPADLAPALKAGFELTENEDPIIVTLEGDAGYVLMVPARIVQAAPAPLAEVRDRVRADWVTEQATARARTVATAAAAKVAKNMSLSDAVAQAGVTLPPVQQVASRRLELTQMGNQVPAPVQLLFSLGEGKSRMIADPEGRGFFIVKVNKITPGNALSQPGIISTVQREFQEPLSQEYGQQFVNAMRKEVGIRRNDSAIAETRRRLTSSVN